MNDKKLYGQFFTISNPFYNAAFHDWWDRIPNEQKSRVLEPFAGSNNICDLVSKQLEDDIEWTCYDIAPSTENAFPSVRVLQRDTLADFPAGFATVITNPPYLAKNSATRAGLPFPDTMYDDLYKYSVDVMLQNASYVAAIIPESFITSGLFHDRLFKVVSLNMRMFEDTDCPVCLALFVPTSDKNEEDIEDFEIWNLNSLIGKYSEKKMAMDMLLSCNGEGNRWRFNDIGGTIGIRCVDGTKTPSIEFVDASTIPEAKVKQSSRSVTRVRGVDSRLDIAVFLQECNKLLAAYRELTQDVFMTSFKGLRDDGKYLRRLDFQTARKIMATAEHNLLEVITA